MSCQLSNHADDQMVQDHKRRLNNLEECVQGMQQNIAKIQGSMSTVEMLVKWVIVPLLVIVGGLVGVRIVLP
jgi:ABC-type uncharacterized transport system involved in gliding motility auxiliary subunit